MIFYGGGGALLGVQILGIVLGGLAFAILFMFGLLRVLDNSHRNRRYRAVGWTAIGVGAIFGLSFCGWAALGHPLRFWGLA